MMAKFLLFLACATGLWAGGPPAPVYPMVPMFHRWDYEKSVERIARAAASGARRVSFTVLLLSELEPGFKVRNFGAAVEVAKPDGTKAVVFRAMTEESRQEMGVALRRAFAEAARRGLEINVLPQIDASGDITEWRNFFDLDPAANLGGFSYETAMLETVVEAMEAAVPAERAVEMTLEGEMGRSLFTYPDAWRAILNRLKSRKKLTQFRIGISANYEGVAGKVEPDATQQEGMRKLVAACDFIGISCYAKASLPPMMDDFTACVDTFCAEFAKAGCPIPEDKPLRFTELGHGGGGFDADWKLTVPAPLMDRMGKAAFFGTDKPDKNPWTTPERIAFRRGFYEASLKFLATQPARWNVETAYLWSYGSWDVHGIHEPLFADPIVADAIRAHNAGLLPSAKK